MSVTASTLIYAALRKAGVTLGPGRTPSPAQSQDALDELNRLLGSLSTDRYFIYGLDILTFPLQAGRKTYTIGPGGDFDTPRPQEITGANVITGSGASTLRYHLTMLTAQQWAAIAMQDQAGTIPEALYNDKASPKSNLSLYGQPMAAMQIELYTWHLIPALESEADLIDLPPGYDDALVLNLACRLAPQFQLQLDPMVLQQARESLMRLESLNAPQPIAILDGPGVCHSRYNIYSDTRK